jgi:hypothetical protein
VQQALLENQRLARERIFSKIYFNNDWGGSESVSGPGSGLARTAILRAELAQLLADLHVGTLLDAPCGDFNWMRVVELGATRYLGVDIVPELIAHNKGKYGNDRCSFLCLDLIEDELPRADLILCRDALVHFSLVDIQAALHNFVRSQAAYLLATTFTGLSMNTEISTGAWRPLNLERPPFNFPPPLKLLDDKRPLPGGGDTGKHLGLWELKTLAPLVAALIVQAEELV